MSERKRDTEKRHQQRERAARIRAENEAIQGEGAGRNIRGVRDKVAKLKNAVHEAEALYTSVRNSERPFGPINARDVLTLLGKNQYFQALQKDLVRDLCKVVFPIPTAIAGFLNKFYESMTPEQRTELFNIGMNFVNIIFDGLTGEKSFSECLSDVQDNVLALGEFCTNNPEIFVKTGFSFVESMIPLNGFLKEVGKEVLKSGLPENFKEELSEGLSNTLDSVKEVMHIFQEEVPRPSQGPRFDE